MPGSSLEEVVLSKDSESLAIKLLHCMRKYQVAESCVFQEKLRNLFKVTDWFFLWEANVYTSSSFLRHFYAFFHDRRINSVKNEVNMLLGNFCTYSKFYIWTGMNFEDSLHYRSCAGNSQQPYVLYNLLQFCY